MKGMGRMKKQNLQRIILKETALFTELYKLYKHCWRGATRHITAVARTRLRGNVE